MLIDTFTVPLIWTPSRERRSWLRRAYDWYTSVSMRYDPSTGHILYSTTDGHIAKGCTCSDCTSIDQVTAVVSGVTDCPCALDPGNPSRSMKPTGSANGTYTFTSFSVIGSSCQAFEALGSQNTLYTNTTCSGSGTVFTAQEATFIYETSGLAGPRWRLVIGVAGTAFEGHSVGVFCQSSGTLSDAAMRSCGSPNFQYLGAGGSATFIFQYN